MPKSCPWAGPARQHFSAPAPSSASAISSAVHAGAGIGILPRVVASPALVPLYVGDELPTRDVWMAMHEDLREIKRVRAVFDFLREILREQLRDT